MILGGLGLPNLGRSMWRWITPLARQHVFPPEHISHDQFSEKCLTNDNYFPKRASFPESFESSNAESMGLESLDQSYRPIAVRENEQPRNNKGTSDAGSMSDRGG